MYGITTGLNAIIDSVDVAPSDAKSTVESRDWQLSGEESLEWTYRRYVTGLTTAGRSLDSIHDTFIGRDTAAQMFTYVRTLMRRRGMLAVELFVGPPAPTGATRAAAVRFMDAGLRVEALHMYTCCMLDTRPGTLDHARAHYGRCNALYEMRRYRDCVRAVRSALDDECAPPDWMRLELYRMAGDAMRKLGNVRTMGVFYDRCVRIADDMAACGSLKPAMRDHIERTVQRAIDRPPSVHDDEPSSRRSSEQDDVPDAPAGGRHADWPAFSKRVDFRLTPDMGHGVFAEQDLEPGDIVAIEESHIGISLEETYYVCCYSACQKINMAIIVCQKCTSAYYCSKICLDKDILDGGHKLECSVLRAVRELPGDKKVNQLALKWFLRESDKMGLDEYCSIVSMVSKTKIDSFTKKKIKNGQYDKFVSSYSMKINTKYIPSKLLLFFNCISVDMLHILSLSGLKIPDKLLPIVGSSLVHMLQVLVTYMNTISGQSVLKIKTDNIALRTIVRFSLYPSISKINHSCDSNVMIRLLADEAVIILIASKPIPKDSQLFISYGIHFYDYDKKQRNSFLQQYFNFQCCCQPCKENWPTFNTLKYSTKSRIRLDLNLYSNLVFTVEVDKYIAVMKQLKDDKESVIANQKKLFDFLKFLFTKVNRPCFLFEDCHATILRANDGFAMDPECTELLKLTTLSKAIESIGWMT